MTTDPMGEIFWMRISEGIFYINWGYMGILNIPKKDGYVILVIPHIGIPSGYVERSYWKWP